MKTILDWLQQNKEWLFSGVGVTGILSLIAMIRWLCRPSTPNAPPRVHGPYHPTKEQRARVDNDGDNNDEDDVAPEFEGVFRESPAPREEENEESESAAAEVQRAADFHKLRRERLWKAAHARFKEETGTDCDINDRAQWRRLSGIYDRLNGVEQPYYCPACHSALSAVDVRAGFRCPDCGGPVDSTEW